MILTLKKTDEIVIIDAVETRLWEGTTDRGVAVNCFIHRIQPQTHDETVLKEFEQELSERPKALFMDLISDFIANVPIGSGYNGNLGFAEKKKK